MDNRFRAGPKIEVTMNGTLPPQVADKIRAAITRAKETILALGKQIEELKGSKARIVAAATLVISYQELRGDNSDALLELKTAIAKETK